MRILHTSDWHLGRTLHGENLHLFHVQFHEFLLAAVREHQVDVVVIAGDVYDRAVPPVESLRLLGETLAELVEMTTVILTPGNHDSAQRLGFNPVLLRDGLHILSSHEGIEHPVRVTDDHGEVLFFGLPFLDPDVSRYALVAGESEPLARSHEAVTRVAMDRVRAKIAQDSASRSVVLAHTFVRGGEASDSERDITVGGVDSVPGGVFAGVDYLALGHLHGCQDVSSMIPGERPVAWYSGSPLAYSFSERHHRKAVLLVDMDETGACEVQRLETPVPRRLVRLTGSLEGIIAKASAHGDDWVHLIVQEDARPAHLQETLRSLYPHLLVTEFVSTRERDYAAAPVVTAATSPAEVVGDFFEYLTGASPSPEQDEIIESILAEARLAVSEAGGAARRGNQRARA